eukprot:gb/GFBE01080116.1/.p1 GENE.gb/GFBE01080116.1/~~gb/GFBE01080116.1/.p1  ORF type:complete len:939 (+),score=224.42 gb/GFBE01080116.1/:1-2817(+)
MTRPTDEPRATFPSLLPRDSFCSRLAKPVLQSALDGGWSSRLLTPFGGPPRISNAAAGKGDDSTALVLPVVPNGPSQMLDTASTASTRRLGRWPVKLDRRPAIPRLAVKRAEEQSMKALTNCTDDRRSSVTSFALRRPPSPSTISEAAYTKDVMGGGFCRAGIDEEIKERSAELAEFAKHRLDAQRESAQRDRDKAVRWQKKRNALEPLYKVRWMLNELPGRPPAPPEQEDCSLPPAIDRGKEEQIPDELLESAPAPPSTPVRTEQVKKGDSGSVRGKQKKGNVEDFEISSEDSEDEAKPLVSKAFLERLAARPHHMDSQRKSRLDHRRKLKVAKMKVMENVSESAKRGDALVDKVQKEMEEEKRRLEELSYNAQADVQAFLGNLKLKDTECYEVVFRQFDRDRTETVDQAELRNMLADMGFRPRNEVERDMISKALEDLDCLEVDFNLLTSKIIPRIRVGLADVRRPQLLGLFRAADEDNSGSLSVLELAHILHRSGFYPSTAEVLDAVLEVMPAVKDDLQNITGQMLLDRNIITMPYFRILAPLLQERAEFNRVQSKHEIAEELNLDEETKQLWQENLVDVQNAFLSRLQHNQTCLEVSELPFVMSETDLMPKKGNARELMDSLVKEEYAHFDDIEKDSEGTKYCTLASCVRILSKIRYRECERLTEIFKINDSDGTNGLSIRECMKCLEDSGVKPRTQKESEQLLALIDEYDVDGSGELELEEFLGMVKFVTERLRKMRRREQADKAKGYGWGIDEFEMMRNAFMGADPSIDNFLDESQIIIALQTVRPDWPTSPDTIMVLKEMGLMTWQKSASVDLFEFLDVVKFIDQRTKHRSIGAEHGLDKEAVDNFCVLWLSMPPSPDDTVAIEDLVRSLKTLPGYAKKMARIQEIINEGSTRCTFEQFLAVMRRSYEQKAVVKDMQQAHETPKRTKLALT